MTDQKLSQLTNITSLADTDELYVNDGGTSKAIDYSVLRNLVRDGGSGTTSLGIGNGKFNCFELVLANNGGTLQHHMSSVPGSGVPFIGSINGASTTPTNTPTGPDASTAFATGLKIGGSNAATIIFDTADLNLGTDTVVGMPSVVYNSTGTAFTCRLGTSSADVNGVTRRRLYFFLETLTGPGFQLNTTNIASGKAIRLSAIGFFPDYA